MSAKQCQNPCPGQPLVYQDMTRHYWAVKMLLLFCQSINQREILGNTLSPLGTQNKEYGHYFADVTNQGKILSTSGVMLADSVSKTVWLECATMHQNNVKFQK